MGLCTFSGTSKVWRYNSLHLSFSRMTDSGQTWPLVAAQSMNIYRAASGHSTDHWHHIILGNTIDHRHLQGHIRNTYYHGPQWQHVPLSGHSYKHGPWGGKAHQGFSQQYRLCMSTWFCSFIMAWAAEWTIYTSMTFHGIMDHDRSPTSPIGQEHVPFHCQSHSSHLKWKFLVGSW